MSNKNTIIIKCIIMAGVLSTSFIYNRSRDVYVMYTHKNTTCSLIKKIYYTPQECARNSNGRPGGVHGLHHDLILDGLLPQNNPLAGNNGNNNNNYLDSLAGLAPIALAMYCFNSAPKLTMVTLTTLLLFIIGSDSD